MTDFIKAELARLKRDSDEALLGLLHQLTDRMSPRARKAFADGYLSSLLERMEAWCRDYERKVAELEIRAGFDPSQPRVPRGTPAGGRWTDTGGGGGSGGGGGAPRTPRVALPTREPAGIARPVRVVSPRLTEEELRRFNEHAPEGTPPEDLEIDPNTGLPYWDALGAVETPMLSPLDLIGGGGIVSGLGREGAEIGAKEVAEKVGTLTVREAEDLHLVLRMRSLGQRATEEIPKNMREAADRVEGFVGTKIDDTNIKVNRSRDITIINGNKKFRMDIKDPGNKFGMDGKPVPDDPHFHLLEFRDGEWIDAEDVHRHYFNKEVPKK